MRGIKSVPATAETDADPRNPTREPSVSRDPADQVDAEQAKEALAEAKRDGTITLADLKTEIDI